jgi:sugar lactone lactonase YvrE
MVAATTGVITTYAGNGKGGFAGDNGAAASAELSSPQGLSVDAAGNLYIADEENNRVRKVAAETGIITTLAGTGLPANLGDNGPAGAAELAFPSGVAVDTGGNVYIACSYGEVVRKITATTGAITTIAGDDGIYDGQQEAFDSGYSGDGGPAISSTLNDATAVAVDGAGNVYIADTGNEVIREITASTGIISTLVGNGSCNALSGDGGPAASASLCTPMGVAVSSAGTLYVSDSWDDRIREVTASGPPPTAATPAPIFSISGGSYPGPQTVTITDSAPGASIYVSLIGTPASSVSPGYNGPIAVTGTEAIQAVAVAPGYLPSAPVSATYTILSPPTAIISTIAGNAIEGFSAGGGPATSVSLGVALSVALDKAGNAYFTDSTNNVVWELSASTGNVTLFAGTGTPGYSGDGALATQAELNYPYGIAVDSAGNVYVADANNNVIRKVTASTGIISTIAGSYRQTGTYGGSIGDGGLATSAYLANPQGLAIDSSGNLYIADSQHYVVRRITAATGIINTVAGVAWTDGDGSKENGIAATSAQLNQATQLAVDAAGNLYISDIWNGHVLKVTASTGIINIVAGNGVIYGSSGDGGVATTAALEPQGLAIDSSGNIYISDRATVREVNAATGIIARIAGNGYQGYFGNGVSATIAELAYPQGLAFDASGNLDIVDGFNYALRKVTFPSPAATPQILLAPGTYVGTQSVNITDATTGAAIYYTTDGTTPTAASNLYGGAVTISSSETLQAIGIATGFTESAVATAAYTISPGVTPTITWTTPAAITYGTALSSAQLDATASVAGGFSYNPPLGTVLSVGQHTLSATFTPTDATDYTSATATVSITVTRATPAVKVTPSSASISATQALTVTVAVNGGAGNPAPTGSVTLTSGSYASKATALTGGSATIRIAAGLLAKGADTLTASYSGDSNYLTALGTAPVTVTAPAAITSPSAGSVFSASTVAFTWNAPAGAIGYSLWLGSTGVGSSNLYNSHETAATSVTVSGLPTNGETIYAQLNTIFNGTSLSIDYTYTAVTQAVITSPASGSVLTGSAPVFTWSTAAGATGYSLWLGTTGVGSSNLYNSHETAATSVTASGLPTNGDTIYAQLNTIVNGKSTYVDTTYKAATLAQSAITSPAPSSTLTGTTVTFTWTATSGATGYSLWLGSTGPGSSNLYNSHETAGTQATATGLPTNGEAIYAQLNIISGSKSTYVDYTYTAK